jgi:hypothetical protein
MVAAEAEDGDDAWEAREPYNPSPNPNEDGGMR